MDEKLKNYIYMKKRIREVGSKVKERIDNYSNNTFRYFEYQGQKINIDEPNQFSAPIFPWKKKEIDKLFELLKKVQKGSELYEVNHDEAFGDWERYLGEWGKLGEFGYIGNEMFFIESQSFKVK